MKLQIKVDDNGIITESKFKTFGCGSAVASSSVATEMIQGMTVDDVLAIKKEKRRLRTENVQLRSILKQFLDGVAVNQEVLSKPNPLLVVNGQVSFSFGSLQLPIVGFDL